jgi:hypothetical protein
VTGRESARGPDNEPLITDCDAVAEICGSVIDEATRLVAEPPGAWGTLDRGQPR